jgi:hypothetical protein
MQRSLLDELFVVSYPVRTPQRLSDVNHGDTTLLKMFNCSYCLQIAAAAKLLQHRLFVCVIHEGDHCVDQRIWYIALPLLRKVCQLVQNRGEIPVLCAFSMLRMTPALPGTTLLASTSASCARSLLS